MPATYRSVQSASNGAEAFKVKAPFGVELDDRLILGLFKAATSTPEAPEGFTLVEPGEGSVNPIPHLEGGGGTDGKLYVYEKPAEASDVALSEEEGSYTWTDNDQAAGFLIAVRDGYEVADYASASSGTSSVTSLNAPSVDAAVDGSLLMVGGACGRGTEYTIGGGVTERADEKVGSGSGNFSICGGTEEVGKGATGTRTITNSNTFGHGGDQMVAFALVLSPPPWEDFQADASPSDFSDFLNLQSPPGRATVVDNFYRFELQPGDVEPETGNHRAEAVPGREFYPGDRRHTRFEARILAWDDDVWGLIQQDRENEGTNPPLCIPIHEGRLRLAHGSGESIYWEGPEYVLGEWFEIVRETLYDPSNGELAVWFNGVKQDLVGGGQLLTGVPTMGPDSFSYAKIGPYVNPLATKPAIVDIRDYRITTEFFSKPPPTYDGSHLWELFYEELGFHKDDDEATDWTLLKFNAGWVVPIEPVYELVRERDDGTPPWGILFDVDECPAARLPYLAQYPGCVLTPEMTEEQIRNEIREPTGWKRGQPEAIRIALRRTLTGEEPLVIIRPRTPEVWHHYIRTLKSQTPDPVRTERVLREKIPAWEMLDYEAIDGVTFVDIAAGWDTFDDLAAALPAFKDLAEVLPTELPE